MKTRNLILGLTLAFAAMFIVSCEDSNVESTGTDYGILPERFKVDVPSSISNEFKSTLKSTEDDTLRGDDIYEHLTNFIAIGEGAADLVEAIMWGIAVHNIDQVMYVAYTSDDDGRVKNLVVEQDVEQDGRTWEYQLTITDELLEGEEDGGIGMQVFWNQTVISGISLIKPSNLDVDNDDEMADAMFSIEYSETGELGYDAHMIVEIADMPTGYDVFNVDALKMFVGKKGDMVDVYGNSNHPDAQFNPYNEKTGYNWAFVASGDDSKNIAVAEVGLPYSSEDITSRTAILDDNSMETVLTREMTDYIVDYWEVEWNITLEAEDIEKYVAPYLQETEAPGFFNASGFVQAAIAPSEEYSAVEARIEDLTPYNPKSISELTIEFK